MRERECVCVRERERKREREGEREIRDTDRPVLKPCQKPSISANE